MTKRDLFDYGAIPVMILATALAFVAAWLGWV